MLAPSGFRPTASGLIVPDEVSRVREVLTRDDWKVIDRAMTILHRHGLSTLMRCQRPGCADVVVSTTPDGGRRIRCDHRDLILTNAF